MSGLGSLYKQKNSKFWWYKISVGGRVTRKSTGATDKRKARDILRAIIERIGAGSFVPTESEIGFAEISALYLHDYEVNGLRSGRDAKRNVRTLGLHFGARRALDIRQTHIRRISERGATAGLQTRASTVNWLPCGACSP